MWQVISLLFLLQAIIAASSTNLQTHAFYYLWYGNPQFNQKYLHWNHEVLPHWNENTRKLHPHSHRHQAPSEIHSPYYPQQGCYSSIDPNVLRQHLFELQHANVNVVVLSWWGRKEVTGTTDTQGVSTDVFIGTVIRIIEETENMYFSLHMEPYPGRNALSVKKDIIHLTERYGTSNSWLKINNKRTFYLYDSYHIPAQDWKQQIASLRNTPNDGFFIGLWLNQNGGTLAKNSMFDGTYSYFASDGFVYGSTTQNWKAMAKWSKANNMVFIPSVGPGYRDTGIRPWNQHNTKPRGKNGEYYDNMWTKAMELIENGVTYVSITSYNEWGEGTQIESAKSVKEIKSMMEAMQNQKQKVYLEYPNSDPYYYMNKTKEWVVRWQNKMNTEGMNMPKVGTLSSLNKKETLKVPKVEIEEL